MAVIVRAETKDKTIYVFEAVGGQGVRLVKWDSMRKAIGKDNFFSHVYYRKVNMCRTKELTNKFIDFAMEAQGHKYELTLDKLTVRASYDRSTFHFGKSDAEIDHTSPEHNHGKFICADRTFFCSELAAKLCKVTGII